MPHTIFQKLQRFITLERAPVALRSEAVFAGLAAPLASTYAALPMHVSAAVPLPEKSSSAAPNLLYFKVAGTPEAPVLTWATTEEPASACFNLERSVDGHAWTSVYLAAAIGDAGRGATYAVPQKASGAKAYYRVRQTMLNGTVTQSDVIAVDGAGKDAATARRITATPNPVGDVLQLKLSDAQPAALALRCPQGITVLRAAAHGASAVLDLKAIPRGVYFLTVMQAGFEEVLRVVKE